MGGFTADYLDYQLKVWQDQKTEFYGYFVILFGVTVGEGKDYASGRTAKTRAENALKKHIKDGK